MSHSCPSDITWEQFTRILPLLESARRRTCYKYFRQWSGRPSPEEEAIMLVRDYMYHRKGGQQRQDKCVIAGV